MEFEELVGKQECEIVSKFNGSVIVSELQGWMQLMSYSVIGVLVEQLASWRISAYPTWWSYNIYWRAFHLKPLSPLYVSFAFRQTSAQYPVQPVFLLIKSSSIW